MSEVRSAFGEFELDGERRLLLRDGVAVSLAPKPLALLGLLIWRAPAAVSKEELVSELWEGAAVSDTALTTVVNVLRSALGESGEEPRHVRTVHGFGYAFQGELRRLPDGVARIYGWLLGLRVKVALAEGETILGRAPGGEGSIEDPSVSRRHARVMAGKEGVTIEDLGSRNGTRVRGEPLEGAVRLEDGDEVHVGLVAVRFRAGSLDPAGETPEFRGRARQD